MSSLKELLEAMAFSVICFLIGSVLIGLVVWSLVSDDAPNIPQRGLLLPVGAAFLLVPLLIGFFVMKKTMAKLMTTFVVCLFAGLLLLGLGIAIYVATS